MARSHPFEWLSDDADSRTRAWLHTQSIRAAEHYPDEVTEPTESALRRAMRNRIRVRPPVQRGGWCYRAGDGGLIRSPAPGDAPESEWQPVAQEVVNGVLDVELTACPYSTPDRPPNSRAMLSFTRGGADSTESIEVDLITGTLVADGLRVRPGIHQVSWDGPDALLVSHRTSREGDGHWAVDCLRRGPAGGLRTRLHDFAPDRVVASITRDATLKRPRYLMIEWLDRRRRSYSVALPRDLVSEAGEATWVPLRVPGHVRVQLVDDLALLMPLAAWNIGDETLPRGSLSTASVDDVAAGSVAPRTMVKLQDSEHLLSLSVARSCALATVRASDHTRIMGVDLDTGGSWEVSRGDSSTRMRATPVDVTDDTCADDFWIEQSGPLTPPRLCRLDPRSVRDVRVIESGRAAFAHEDFDVWTSTTTQGPMPPVRFTVVAPAGMSRDGENPTVLTGYGGFHVQSHIDYLDLTGTSWLDPPKRQGRRGVYVFAHVGSGLVPGLQPWERLAASVEQFLAVAKQLALEGVARPHRLGALGVSHGGLLVMNAMLDRPAAFAAVACRSAVLDLIGFPELDGTAWISEYGDPRDDATRRRLLPLSPLHRIASGVDYPPVLCWTADNDDRVSPAHARRTTARLAEVGSAAYHLETPGGGHDALANTAVGAHGLAVTAAFWRRHLAK